MADAGNRIASIDVNPFLINSKLGVAVDGLIVLNNAAANKAAKTLSVYSLPRPGLGRRACHQKRRSSPAMTTESYNPARHCRAVCRTQSR